MNRYEVILESITEIVLTNHLHSQFLRASPNTSLMVNLETQLQKLVDALAQSESVLLESDAPLKSIVECCIPCAIFDGDCCGVLFATDEGDIKCNECDREFKVKVRDTKELKSFKVEGETDITKFVATTQIDGKFIEVETFPYHPMFTIEQATEIHQKLGRMLNTIKKRKNKICD